jgi:hypothetical protein
MSRLLSHQEINKKLQDIKYLHPDVVDVLIDFEAHRLREYDVLHQLLLGLKKRVLELELGENSDD